MLASFLSRTYNEQLVFTRQQNEREKIQSFVKYFCIEYWFFFLFNMGWWIVIDVTISNDDQRPKECSLLDLHETLILTMRYHQWCSVFQIVLTPLFLLWLALSKIRSHIVFEQMNNFIQKFLMIGYIMISTLMTKVYLQEKNIDCGEIDKIAQYYTYLFLVLLLLGFIIKFSFCTCIIYISYQTAKKKSQNLQIQEVDNKDLESPFKQTQSNYF